MEFKIALVIVLYNEKPLDYIYNNPEIPVIIVDNTEHRDLCLRSDNLYYIPLKDNFGIAYALNVGFEKARHIGVNWIITMDQDSEFPSNMVEEYRKFLSEGHEKVGIVAPLINMYKGENKHADSKIEIISEALASGSMVSLEAYDRAGGFKVQLFIDAVDFEFCYNLSSLGYIHYQINNVVMQHQLGETKEYKFLGKHLFYVTNHSYVRHYYMHRNGLYLKEHYASLLKRKPFGLVEIAITLLKIVFFEKDRYRKLKAHYWGWKDYKNNIFGKLNHNI